MLVTSQYCLITMAIVFSLLQGQKWANIKPIFPQMSNVQFLENVVTKYLEMKFSYMLSRSLEPSLPCSCLCGVYQNN